MRIIALLILLVSVAALPLAKSGEHASHIHATQFKALADHHHDSHSHELDDEVNAADSSDHHHGDHTHEKASIPATMHERLPVSLSPSCASHVDDHGQDRLYDIDRPPRRLTLA